ncbi:DUF1801 domain-containing protein [Staphylococcus sp. IVB6181]|uniref:DUF1801 domain-containing protein n=1 Tax=Staphylococcus sp. IVB6181 TaxID=2929481 RepID=UPI0021D15FF7|nr:DUF1801 domain-containing protein [Staphylococcus sp. IVB6181]UXV34285.1 DUF1801 domain-containing protein [Staphylococcus sp. IVB6181]
MTEIEDYIAQIDGKRRPAFVQLFEVILKHLPKGFQPVMQYGMPTFAVPLERYPQGYLGNPDVPLPFVSIAAQKNFIGLYHMGLYGDEDLKSWFIHRYEQEVPTKLNMGKSCVRMSNPKNIPYDLIADLCEKITVEDLIRYYKERNNKIC